MSQMRDESWQVTVLPAESVADPKTILKRLIIPFNDYGRVFFFEVSYIYRWFKISPILRLNKRS